MNFLYKEYFYWFLVIIPVVVVLFYLAKARRSRILSQILGSNGFSNVSMGRRAMRCGLLLAVMLLIIVAIARPWWGSVSIPFSSNGRDILVLFDVSKSMLASDVAPSRLAHAKFILRELVEKNSGDRFGLAAFAGDTFLLCPLTSDKTSFIQYIDDLNCDSIPVGGTNIERALTLAEGAFEASESNFRAILLITDGDELTGNSKKIIANLKAKNIPLFIIGLGDPQLPALIPDGKNGYMRDKSGELVKSKLAESELQNLALATGGVYVRSTSAESGLQVIEQHISALMTNNNDSGIRSVPIERFPYFLSAAAILLLGYFLLGERKSGAAILALMFSGLLLTAEELPQNTKVSTTNPVATYNEALDLQKNHKEGSEQLYQEAIKRSLELPEVRSRSFFNLAVDRQVKAEQIMKQATAQLNAQQLDNAQKGLADAQKQLKGCCELYSQALSIVDRGANPINPGKNLQKLYNSQKEVDELLKNIEELKKQQQKAQQETQKAQQQQENQQQNQQQMQSASDAAQKLEQQAKDLKQDKLSNDAKQAQEEIKKAQEESKNNQPQKSAEHLKKALEKLGAGQQGDEPKSSKDGEKESENEPKDGQDKLPKNQPQQGKNAPKKVENGKLDKDSAEKLLEMLADQEKDLRDAMKAKMKQQQIKVEKDW